MEEVRTDLVEIASLVKSNIERELLLRNEYLAAENEILRARIEGSAATLVGREVPTRAARA